MKSFSDAKAAKREEWRNSLGAPDPALRDAAQRDWLRAAYGVEAASQVMSLSEELREEFYPEVLRFGPAGVAVQGLFDAGYELRVEVWDAVDLPEVDPQAVIGWLQGVEEDGRDMGRVFAAEDGNPVVDYLIAVLDDEAYARGSSDITPMTSRLLLMGALILTAPFYPVSLSQFVGLEGYVNEVLGRLGLPLMAVAGEE